MRTNYVLIDYENVQPDILPILDGEHFKVIVFVGATQAKVHYDIAESLQKMGARAEYVKVAGSGSNALDFHIAYYIGVLAAKEEGAYFHIISKDTGFDPLIRHLKSKKILASRCATIHDIPLVANMKAKSPADRMDIIITNLARRGSTRPRLVKTLGSTINSIFQKQLSSQEIDSFIEKLKHQGVIKVDGLKVTYSFPV